MARYMVFILACLLSAVAAQECTSLMSCSLCLSDADCGWCNSTGKCVPGNTTDPTQGICTEWNYNYCPSDPCTSYPDCATCLQDPNCGWCGGSASNYCILGNSTGPIEGSCGAGTWDFFLCPVGSGLTFEQPTGSDCQFNCDGTLSDLSMVGPDAPSGCATTSWVGSFVDPIPTGETLTSFNVSFDMFFWEDFAGGTDALSYSLNGVALPLPNLPPTAKDVCRSGDLTGLTYSGSPTSYNYGGNNTLSLTWTHDHGYAATKAFTVNLDWSMNAMNKPNDSPRLNVQF